MATSRASGYVVTATVWNAVLSRLTDDGVTFSGNFNGGSVAGTTGAFTTGVATGTGAVASAAYAFKGYLNDANVGANGGVYLEQDGAGDCNISFLLSATINWLIGIDNSDSDAFLISNITGGTDYAPVGLRIDATGSLRVTGSEGSDAALALWADNGDDSADKWSISSSASGSLVVLQDATTYLTLNSGGLSNETRYNSATLQYGFCAYNSADDASVGSGTNFDFDTEVYDTGACFSADTFTAPVTGRYYLSAGVLLRNTAGAGSSFGAMIVTSTHPSGIFIGWHDNVANNDQVLFSGSAIVNMNAGDTATVQYSGSGTVTVRGDNTGLRLSWFCGRLVP